MYGTTFLRKIFKKILHTSEQPHFPVTTFICHDFLIEKLPTTPSLPHITGPNH
jgi:hypothetical protein